MQSEPAGDDRLPIVKRHRNRDDYANRIRIAGLDLIDKSLLLPDEALVIVQAAAASTAF